jgi:hypothetical protein
VAHSNGMRKTLVSVTPLETILTGRVQIFTVLSSGSIPLPTWIGSLHLG